MPWLILQHVLFERKYKVVKEVAGLTLAMVVKLSWGMGLVFINLPLITKLIYVEVERAFAFTRIPPPTNISKVYLRGPGNVVCLGR